LVFHQLLDVLDKVDIRNQLGQRTRRVQINEFKGKQLVDFREFYEKDDQMLPGKKVCSTICSSRRTTN
jgi:hypothetical protein